MEGSNYGENVRPVRAQKKGRKMRRERETKLSVSQVEFVKILVVYF